VKTAWRRGAAAVALAVLAGLAAGCGGSGKAPPGEASATPTPAPPEGAPFQPAAPAALPESEVPRAAIAAETRIRSIRSLAGRTRETDAIASSAKPVFASVESLKEWMRARDPRQQTPRALRSVQQEWRLYDQELAAWMETTGRRLDTLSSARAELRDLENTWAATRTKLVEDRVAPEIVDRAQGVLGAIREVTGRIRSETEKVLLLQSRISEAKLDVEEGLESVAAALVAERKTLFKIESPPIWNVIDPETGRHPVWKEFLATVRESGRAIRHYADRAQRSLGFQLLLFVLLLAAFHRLRPGSRAWPSEDRGVRACARLVQSPFMGACLVALLSGRWIHPRAPLAFYELSSTLLVVPVVYLMVGIVHPRVRASLHALAALFVAERLWEVSGAGTFLERVVLLGLTALSAVALVWTIRPQASLPEVVSERWWRVVTVAGRFALVALLVSLVANVVGNATLARLLTGTVVRMSYAGVVLYAAALLLRGTAALLVRSAAARSFRAIGRHGELILRRVSLAIDATVVVLFALVVLSSTSLLPVIGETLENLLTRRWGIGDFRFSFVSALVFVASVYASVLVSRAIRAVLEEDVYPRVSLPRGVPDTVTMLIRYGVISVGFLLACAIAGIPLDRFAMVLGALSVGIGFGLQAVVNNFVSGLILMFERPIQIGDAVEVSGLVGRVRRIGVRASTIETFDGAEVVVPNGTLVSNQLINWTLSSRNRRIEIQVGVAYGTDPDKVLALLCDAAKGRPGVLADPEPWALFRGFGPSSLDFSLYFWTSDFDNWMRVKSEVTVLVNRALRDAGIEIPFPQHDVHMRG
jgi:potassium-dependent mechanosensitive channel